MLTPLTTVNVDERRLPSSGTRGRENNQSFGVMETACKD